MKEDEKLDWALKDKIGEAKWYIGAIKDMCKVIGVLNVTDIPPSVFLAHEILCKC